MLGSVERFAARKFLYLPRRKDHGARHKSPPHYPLEDHCALILDIERHARMRRSIEHNKAHERIPKAEEEKDAVNHVISARQVMILLFVENHEAVMLLDQMVVSPERGEEEKLQTVARQIKRWAKREESETAI